MYSLYQRFISPFIHALNTLFFANPVGCRFHPSCSEYARQAVSKYGIMRGSILSIKRILRCHPFSSGGRDPLV